MGRPGGLVIDHPYQPAKCDGYIDTYSPTSGRVRIVYVCVFQE